MTVLQRITKTHITVPRYPHPELHDRAVAWFNRQSYMGVVKSNATEADLHRIYVNFLRHGGTDYDKWFIALRHLPSEVRYNGVETLRHKIYRAIVGVYPWLATECARQQAERAEAQAAYLARKASA